MHSNAIANELDAIEHLLARTDVANGDDAAALSAPKVGAFCVSTDSTVAGVHAPRTQSMRSLGRRAMARALSDLAAMGARPIGVTCAVHVPPVADGWDQAMHAMEGAIERAQEQRAPVVGGDLTRLQTGALALVVTVFGAQDASVDARLVHRSGALAGDELWVSGSLGASRAALVRVDDALPEPPDRIDIGAALAPFATAMIDVSDGLERDAAALACAGAGIDVFVELNDVPLADASLDPAEAASAGDDYELLFTLPTRCREAARAACQSVDADVRLTRIGLIADGSGLVHFTRSGVPVTVPSGFVHR